MSNTFIPSPVKTVRVQGVDLPVANLAFFDKHGFVRPGPGLIAHFEAAHEARQAFTVKGSVLILGDVGITGATADLLRLVEAWEILDLQGVASRSLAKLQKLQEEEKTLKTAEAGLARIQTLLQRKKQRKITPRECGEMRTLWQKKESWETLLETRKDKFARSLAFARKCHKADLETLQAAREGNGPYTAQVTKALS